MTDYKIIADNLNKINPPLEIPDELTKDKGPYYLSYPYLSTYGSLPDSGGDDNVKKPLTFKITSPGYINWTCIGESAATIEYSKNGGEWTEITATPMDPEEMTGGTKIDVVSGDIVQFRGDNDAYTEIIYHAAFFGTFANSTCSFNLEGNIMSLIDSTNFSSITAMTTNNGGAFASMFVMCIGLTSAENLLLPATTLANECYGNMFAGCTSLTIAPKLSATTLAQDCYYNMFADCTSLTTAPSLPATTLTEACYDAMFLNCTSLTTAPLLPATTLAERCYNNMFAECSSLTTAPELPATTLADYCYSYMFYNCTSLTTAPELPATTLAEGCYEGMFISCVSLTSVTVYAIVDNNTLKTCATGFIDNNLSGTLYTVENSGGVKSVPQGDFEPIQIIPNSGTISTM